MRSILVAPGVPSGTPAEIMTRCPGSAKPSWGRPEARRAGGRVADDRRDTERLGHGAGCRRNGIGAGRLPSDALGVDDGFVEGIALDLDGHAIHVGHGPD